MKRLPGVSIVMPLLNQREFLASAVESVMSQELDALELIVMDGGSTDGSQALLAELENRYAGRLRWQSQADNGPAQALNRAVRLAQYELLGWLAADDLFAPGALRRAAEALAEHPEWQLVYGEGTHVDRWGKSLGRYPTTKPPVSTEDFARGSPVCQPTLVMRRAVWLAAGGVDETLRASFDYELWLRLFSKLHGQIGFLDTVQACSRLHDDGITQRQRERVAFEGLQILQRHLGQAPAHWVLTHFEERLAGHFRGDEPVDLKAELEAMAERARPYLPEEERAKIRAWLDQDQRLATGSALWHSSVLPDGWMEPAAELHVRAAPQGAVALRISGAHAQPGGGALRLQVIAPDGKIIWHRKKKNGGFELRLPLPRKMPPGRKVWRFKCEGFVPADVDPGNSDQRRVGWLLKKIEWV